MLRPNDILSSTFFSGISHLGQVRCSVLINSVIFGEMLTEAKISTPTITNDVMCKPLILVSKIFHFSTFDITTFRIYFYISPLIHFQSHTYLHTAHFPISPLLTSCIQHMWHCCNFPISIHFT